MGRTIYAEENLFSYLKNVSKSGVCTTGLILGQSGDSKDYIVHLVRTPEPADKEPEPESDAASPATFQSVKEIKETWIADHAKHVIKMLPGGMWVLGVFICSPNDLFSDNSAQAKAKSVLLLLNKHLSSEPLLHASSPTSSTLLLHLNTTDQKYCCKTLDTRNITSSFQSADWKFQNNYTKWCQIYCNLDPIQPSYGGNMSCPVKDQLKNALHDVNKKLEKAIVTLNGQIRNPDETLEAFIKKGSSKDSQKMLGELPVVKANIFFSFEKETNEKTSKSDIVIKDCDVELHLQGILASYVFLSQKSSIGEAISAVKQDLVRSLAARFEMHWDSLVEEEYGSPEEKLSVHEPPRRVSVSLPESKISFNDYLFPGEGASEVISSFKEMLDLDINETNLEQEIESQGDPMEFYGTSSISLSKNSPNELLGPAIPKGFLFSIGVILIAIAIALYIRTQNGFKAI